MNKRRFGILKRMYRVIKITSFEENRHSNTIRQETRYYIQTRNFLRKWKFLKDIDEGKYSPWPDSDVKFNNYEDAMKMKKFMTLREEKKCWKVKVEVVGKGEELGRDIGIL